MTSNEPCHRLLTSASGRAAATVFLMGLVGTGLVVLVSRSSQLRLSRLNEALAQESRTDGLTQTANRRAWDEALARAESRRRRHHESYGLIVVDLDGFKSINDLQGHQRGDAVLQQTARNLSGSLRTTDLLARVGGDEFAILLVRPDADSLKDLVSRLNSALAEDGIKVSIGAAITDADHSLEETWHRADANMYAQKRR